MALKPIDQSEVKYYPGSIKGPNPEDDPRAYIEWFMRSRPKELQEEDPFDDFKSVGGKVALKPQLEEKQEDNQVRLDQMEAYFNCNDPLPPTSMADKCFIQMITDKDQYPNGDAPMVTIDSYTGEKGLAPVPPNLSEVFQYMHPQIEKWLIFSNLPEIFKLRDFLQKQDNALASQISLEEID